MAKVLRSIDIGTFPELVRRVEDALASGEPVVLRDGDRELAIVESANPEVAEGRTVRRLSPEALDAFLSSAGGWKGVVDADQLLRDIYAGRGRPMEPEDE